MVKHDVNRKREDNKKTKMKKTKDKDKKIQ